MIGADNSVFIHVGDGAFVCRAEGAAEWIVPTWPAQGEYAATTFFVTDEPEARLQFVNLDQSTEELAVFSDGIERLALEFSSKTAFSPFFEKMFAPLNGTALEEIERSHESCGAFSRGRPYVRGRMTTRPYF